MALCRFIPSDELVDALQQLATWCHGYCLRHKQAPKADDMTAIRPGLAVGGNTAKEVPPEHQVSLHRHIKEVVDCMTA